ncbi:hypothetical protein E2C01_034926 [Portunus trituberculatus]|uniref:Uncharacterized protein n=1 Tax=Portunus trituberculatus TaxID=210409 RepID=A0A5B7F896_PORTR|nr:hypothetical protein [Portunus trituberculatus]
MSITQQPTQFPFLTCPLLPSLRLPSYPTQSPVPLIPTPTCPTHACPSPTFKPSINIPSVYDFTVGYRPLIQPLTSDCSSIPTDPS